jgi:hypothetical protein
VHVRLCEEIITPAAIKSSNDGPRLAAHLRYPACCCWRVMLLLTSRINLE